MTCEPFNVPGLGKGFVCGRFQPRDKCRCGNRATLLCDWKVPNTIKHSQTCDAPLCPRCTTSPGPDKDLCPRHAAEFARWKATRIAV